ncbi:MAG: YceI family protein [Taibaiella sp.]|nr:YceI family protein [Taibaiella sp.]
MIRTTIVAFLLLISGYSISLAGTIYKMQAGVVNFYSTAPQELIHASSEDLRGAIDPDKKTFAFKISIVSFKGFNNALQQEHFNENYMESTVFSQATFIGKIIEDVDFSKNGEYDVRAKGKLLIHGIEHERLVKAHITTKDGKMNVHAEFILELSDYNVKIPRIVDSKLANNIRITVNAQFIPNK